MSNIEKLFLFVILPALAPVIYPPATLLNGLPVILLAMLVLMLIGVLTWRGHRLALALNIFLQGFNVIIRLMMFFPHAVSRGGEYDFVYIITALASIGLSWYLLMRLDKTDVRMQMVT